MAKAKTKSKPKLVVLEVTLKRQYAFVDGEINGWNPETVIRNWFGFPLNVHHAARDTHRVGNSDELVSVRRI